MREIPSEQVQKRLAVENPWWLPPHQLPSPFSDWTPRPYRDLFLPLVTNREVHRAVVLMGPRRVGKTVLLHHVIRDLLEQGTPPERICYFSVDHPIYNGLSLEQLLDEYVASTDSNWYQEPCYFFFDEIQYLRNWENHLKVLLDQFPLSKFVVSGSAAAALRLSSIESGAGRFTDFLLPPLTFHEYLTLLGSQLVQPQTRKGRITFVAPDIESLNAAFLHYINFGGYPEVVFNPRIQEEPGRFIKTDIVDKVLLRDLPSLYGVQDIQELNYLFTALAFNTASEISLEGLSQRSRVAKNTIKRYIEYLQAAFLIKIVHRVDRNSRRFRRANYFKVYLTNPSIRTALFSPISAEDDSIGSLVETAIFAQWFHADVNLHYARWKDGEVDIIQLDSEQRPLWAVEVKWTDSYLDQPEKLNSLLTFSRTNGLTRAMVTTKGATGRRVVQGVDITFRPAALYCYTLGYNIVSRKKASVSATD